MGEFIGIVRWDGAPIDRATCSRLTGGIGDQPKAQLWREGQSAIADRPATLTDRPGAPDWCDLPSGAVLVADARLDDRSDASNALGVPTRSDDLAILAAACDRWGDDAPVRLYGDFAYATWDARLARLVLARSALGVRTLYYATGEGWIAFATTIRALLRLPEVPRDLDDLAIANYLTMARDPDRSLYRHIKRVPPGGTVIIDRGKVQVARYWTPQSIRSVRFKHDDDYVDAARELFDRAVASRLPDGNAAIMLSGGFDSAAIAATAARLLGDRRLAAYTRVPGTAHSYDLLDEGAYARQVAARHANIDWQSIDDDPRLTGDADQDREHARLALPRAGAFNAAWFDPLLQAAERDDAQVLFNGVAGNLGLTWQGVPPYAELLQSGRVVKMIREAWRTSRVQRRSLRDVLRRDLIATLEPATWRLRRFRRDDEGASIWQRHSAIRGDFLETIDFDDYAAQLHHDPLLRWNSDPIAERMRISQTPYPRDMLSANRHRFSFEREDPMSDRRLIEFSFGVPLDQYVRGGQNRWLARRVFADRLPAALLAEHRKGRQSPEWYEVATSRRGAIGEAIERLEGSPAASRVIDLPRLKRIYDAWPADAASAARHQALYRNILHRGVTLGNFLRWHEGGNS